MKIDKCMITEIHPYYMYKQTEMSLGNYLASFKNLFISTPDFTTDLWARFYYNIFSLLVGIYKKDLFLILRTYLYS